MQLVGSRGQQVRDFMLIADGSCTGGGSPVLILPERKSTSFLAIQNISNGGMYLEFGSARATATISGGIVTSCAVTNGGFGFTQPPSIEFFGGGSGGNSTFVGVGLFGYPSPGSRAVGTTAISQHYRPAQAQCVIAGGVVTSITVTDGGAGYVVAPYVQIKNREVDPIGCADPSLNSGGGLFLSGGSAPFILNGTFATTDQCAIFGNGSGTQKFTCRWVP